MGLEKVHSFDSKKWSNVYKFLVKHFLKEGESVVKPDEITANELLKAHTPEYLDHLKKSLYISKIVELPFLAVVPNCLLQKYILKPFRYQTKGSIVAGQLALNTGWAINIGGGFHHACSGRGGGFCVYADITLLIKNLFEDETLKVKKAMIVDLDAHQGNGHSKDFMYDSKVFIMDVYNHEIYPQDEWAKGGIDCRVELRSFTRDDQYLEVVERNLELSLNNFKPDILVFNAGTDILDGDRLGKLCVSDKGIIARDEIVFRKSRELKVPIVMLTSGGYTPGSAKVIGHSIMNLLEKGLLSFDNRGPHF